MASQRVREAEELSYQSLAINEAVTSETTEHGSQAFTFRLKYGFLETTCSMDSENT